MELDLLDSDSDSDHSIHSHHDDASVQRSMVTAATAGSDAGKPVSVVVYGEFKKIPRIIMLHFYRAIFLTSQIIQWHTHTSIRIKKNVNSITKNKSIGSVIKIKINQCSTKIESIVSL